MNLFFSSVWRKKVWRINRSAKGLLIVTTTLDGFSLANHERFAKFAKLSRYTVIYENARQRIPFLWVNLYVCFVCY